MKNWDKKRKEANGRLVVLRKLILKETFQKRKSWLSWKCKMNMYQKFCLTHQLLRKLLRYFKFRCKFELCFPGQNLLMLSWAGDVCFAISALEVHFCLYGWIEYLVKDNPRSTRYRLDKALRVTRPHQAFPWKNIQLSLLFLSESFTIFPHGGVKHTSQLSYLNGKEAGVFMHWFQSGIDGGVLTPWPFIPVCSVQGPSTVSWP